MKYITTKIKENKHELLVTFLLLLVFTGIFSLNRSAPDTYSLESYEFLFQDNLPYFKDGRFFMTIFVLILKTLNFPYRILKLCSWTLAFISLYSGILIFNGMLKKSNKRGNILLSFLTIANIFVLEFFIFSDYSGIMCLGILFATISAKFFLDFLIEHKKKLFILSMLFSLFTAFCYQGTIALVVILPIVFTLKYSQNIKEFITNNICLMLVYAIPTFFALIIGKIIGTNRLAPTDVSIFDKIDKIFKGVMSLLTSTATIIPKYIFIILLVINLLVVIVAFWKKDKKFIYYLFLFYCLLAGLIVPLAPQFVIDYENIWIVPRSSVGLGIICLIPILIYYIYSKKNEKVITVLSCTMLLLAICQFRGYLLFGYHQIRNNILEEKESIKILEKFYNYEKENKKIKNISIYTDKNITYNYQDIKVSGDMNVRIGARPWGVKAMLFRSINRSLKDKENKDFERYCQNHDWTEFNNDTIKIEDDTIYICIY